MSIEETANVMDMSVRTVERTWKQAKEFLRQVLCV